MKAGRSDLILAFHPHARGFAYVVFEGQHFPVEWGMSDVRRKEKARRCLRRLSDLFDRFSPGALVLLDRRQGATKEQSITLLGEMTELAERRGVPAVAIPRERVRAVFASLGSDTRYAVAEAIARHIPAFAPLLPPARKIWNGEDRRMGLFDAAALGLAFLSDHGRSPIFDSLNVNSKAIAHWS